MLNRKVAALGLSVLMSMSVVTVPAFAHGHHSGGHHRRAVADCPVRADAAVTDGMTVPGCPVHDGSGADCPVCTIEGCTEAGHHYHNDEVYCGYRHGHGYCDGTCVQAGDPAPSEPTPSTTRYYQRHHGCY